MNGFREFDWNDEGEGDDGGEAEAEAETERGVIEERCGIE